jgi:hypothetical protein
VPFDSGEVVQTIQDLLIREQGVNTLPEEPSFDEAEEMDRKFQKRLDAVEKKMSGQIRNVVKKEIYEAVKEVEKRVKAGVLKEIKTQKDR